jgi:methanogenic corrinoid protein MtbC1
MNNSIVSASEIERETGLNKDLLRKWRSRYGFPNLVQGMRGEPGYTKEQIAQLRLVRRLLNAGFRPVQVVGKSLAELTHLVEAMGLGGEDRKAPPFARQAIGLLKQFALNELDQLLVEARRRLGLTDFIEQTVAPLVVSLGEAWARGEIEVYHEHFCTSLLMRRLFNEIEAAQSIASHPRILFATPSDELHTLGLLMAQAVLADQGAECINLGSHIPLSDLEKAILGCKADIVALSFSFAFPKWRVRPLLAHLRERLPATVEIWAGGAGTASIKRTPTGIRIFSDLHEPVVVLQRMLGNGTDKSTHSQES